LFVYLLVCLFVCLLVHSFACSLVRSSIHPLAPCLLLCLPAQAVQLSPSVSKRMAASAPAEAACALRYGYTGVSHSPTHSAQVPHEPTPYKRVILRHA
jgi:hypothetical protein